MLRLFIMKGGICVHANPCSEFFGKPFPSRPANPLCCSPVSAVCLILYSSLQSDGSEFLLSTLFCFFRMADSGSLFLVH